MLCGLVAAVAQAEQFLYHGIYYTVQTDGVEFQSEDVVVVETDRGPLTVRWSSLSPTLQRRFAAERERYIADVAAERQAEIERQKAAADPRKYILAKVVSVIDTQTVLASTSHNHIVLLRGVSDKVDGQSVFVRAVRDGTYTYTTVLGAVKTVRAYRVVEEVR